MGMMVLLGMLAGSCSCTSENPRQEAQEADTASLGAVDSLVADALSRQLFSGAVVRVQQGDSLLHRRAYGYARRLNPQLQVVDHPEPMTPDHLFDLASLTKVLATTFGIMILVEQGRFTLDTPVSTWLPAFGSGRKRTVTVRHLLSHTAGLYPWKPTYYHASSRPELYAYIGGLPLAYGVGKDRHYSDLGFMLLGMIIERETGTSLDTYLDEEVYGRLGLEHTGFNPMQKGLGRVAATSHGNPFERHMVYDDSFGYTVDEEPSSWDGWRSYTLQGQVNDGNAWYTAGGVAGHAGLFSTADEIQQLLQLLFSRGRHKGRSLISPAVIDTFLTSRYHGNGLGWAMDPDIIHSRGAPGGTFGHTGFTGTSIVAVPSRSLSVIILTNRQHVGPDKDGYYADLGPLRQQIFDAVWAETK